ncbi:extracellular solute-binding protein [Dactylosporangium sp. AC04546]|uniref:ABC transporter substrate-binding protein n=1 Tax=Dactylosporangium sp. AC04546 TaxID=2862460 RepID=UPI001EDE7892|nr:extracellular solute-binding protein [Dactylosporangium sp. AC04546]WVK78495.1 extracellular solute-binding protein [Dactylosporangium sp. AC04546]
MKIKRNGTIAAALTAAVLAVTALAGCGGDSSGQDGGKTVVTFWQQKFEDYQQAWFKKYVDQYNASQDKVKIDYQVVPADTWQQKLKAAQAAGKAPDVATTSYGNIASGVAQGQFAELDGLLPAEAFTDVKDNVKSFVTVKGKHYAYPMLVEPSTVLYYRTDLVKAAGLDPASPPKSWADLITWATKLTAGNVKGMSIASAAPDLGWSSWGLQYNACGHLPIEDDWSKARASDPCFTKLLEFYKSLYQGGLIPKQPKVGYADGSPYGQGEVAMMAGGSWVVGQLKKEFPAMVAKTAVAAFPSIDGDATKTTATLGGWTLTVDGKSKAKQQAADFVKYLLAGDAAIMADFFQVSGFSKYTVRTSVDAALAGKPEATADPFMKVISEQVVKYGKQEPAYPWDIALAFGTAIESAMKGSADIPASLRTADKAINDVIEKQQLKGTAPIA